MAGPFDGIKVVELGVWVAGPAAAGVLADWGAEVIKIEPHAGDPLRGFFRAMAGQDLPLNPPFELDNRGKRSIQIDIAADGGAALVASLADRADVFVTNVRPTVLRRLGLDYDDLAARNPRLVYARVTGYGERGPERDRQAYDLGAYWSRAGVAAALTSPGGEPPYMRGGFGDHTTALSLIGGIATALFARERSGVGQLVTTSLLRTGMYVLGFDLNSVLRLGAAFPQATRETMGNPLTNCYRSGDDRWFWLLGLQADRHWPDLARAVGRPEWIEDARFREIHARGQHRAELVRELDVIFAGAPLAEWARRLDEAGMWWAPVQTLEQVAQDPQAEAAGGFVDVPAADGGTTRMVANPVDYAGTPWQPRAPVPEPGQHTEEVLLEHGYDWEKIAALKARGVIP
jgi:crotonobetainyl-CoA:carnitine CoA-transferase CaiB-like acyl-CoA transferase